VKSFGSDRAEPGPGGSFRLVCLETKDWMARRPKTLTSPEHPGTAVLWCGELFEVFEALPEAFGGVVYVLAPWEARHTVRRLSPYDESSEIARHAERDWRRAAIWKRRASLLLAPILGHLPARIQQRMESEFGAPARGMTIASALPLLVLGALGILAFLVTSFGGRAAFTGWPILPVPLAILLFGESAIRLGVAFLQGEPAGSLAGVLLCALWREASRLVPNQSSA